MKFILIAMFSFNPWMVNLGEFNSLEDCKLAKQAIISEVSGESLLVKPRAMVCVPKGKETK